MIQVYRAIPKGATLSDIYTEDLGEDIVGAGRQFAQGLTLGGSDEAEAIIKSVLGDKSYNENIDQIRSEMESFAEKNPGASTGAYITGVLPTLIMSVPALATKLGVTGTSAALGGLEGFLAGEGVEGRAKDAALVGTLSGLLGYGGEKAVKFVSPKVSEFFQKLKNKVTSEIPIDLSRREALGAIAAAPVAVGALSEVPVGKIMEDVMPVSDIPVVKPVASKIAGAVVENVGQPSRTRVINELMDFTDFGKGPQYGDETMKESIENFSSELNKSKKYFEMKKKAVDQDELDMISSNSEMSDYLENLQIQFGYTDDEIINFINKTDSTTRKNTKVWETYLEFGGAEGDPDVGKKLGLGDESENWENWSEDELWEKFYGSNEEDIVGKIISEVSE